MRLSALPWLLLFPLPCGAVSQRHDLPSSAYEVSDAAYPALVDLFKNDCIGTLIEPSHLLTAAHCTTELGPGSTLKIGGSTHRIRRVIRHPAWDDDRNLNDIALLRLETPVEGVAPVPVYRGSRELGQEVYLVGRGAHTNGLRGEPGSRPDGKLRRATNRVSRVTSQNLVLTFERPGQAGITGREGIGVAGDSGCPVFLEVGGIPHVAGLNSWGEGKGPVQVGQYGAVDYQTRVSRFVPWLLEHLKLP